jgi:Asp-tRNA(Asn)/Glu-tRNA(Gln) amidotransferase B subunit
LGGNLKEWRLTANVSNVLTKFLSPFDELTKEDLKSHIHFDNLPEDFFDQLKHFCTMNFLRARSIKIGLSKYSIHLMAKDQDLLDYINAIGSSDEKFYKIVSAKYQEMIQQFETKILYYYQRKLDDLYYTKKIKEASLSEIIELVDSVCFAIISATNVLVNN